MPLTVVVVDIEAAASTVLFLCPAIEVLETLNAAELIVRIRLLAAEVLAEILVLGRPNRTLLTASAVTVVTEAAMSEVRTLLAASTVLEETEVAAAVSLTRTAAKVVVLAIDALADASTILASRAANGADASGLKPSIYYPFMGAVGAVKLPLPSKVYLKPSVILMS